MTENGASGSKGLGNTDNQTLTVKRRPSPKFNYCFTWNNPKMDPGSLELTLKDICKKYIFQLEEGSNLGTRHYQGYISLIKKARITELKKLIHNDIHFEESRGNEQQNAEYCSKSEGRIEGPWAYNIKVKKPLRVIENLYPWQQYIVDMVRKEPDDRSIVWIYEPTGGMGKTQLCKYLAHHYGAIPLRGKSNDILHCVAEYESDIYMYNIPRTMEDYVPYESIELIKDMLFMSGKYESKPVNRNSPHVLVFSNFPPDTTKLSKDRWVIINLDELNRNIIKKLELVSQNAFKDIEPEYDITFE